MYRTDLIQAQLPHEYNRRNTFAGPISELVER
jgi:hypothetical protein